MRHLLLGVALPALAVAQGGSSARSGDLDLSLDATQEPDWAKAEWDWQESASEVPEATVGGSAGLLRVRTADVGPAGSFRIGLHTEMFTKAGFLVKGDEHSRFVGTLAAAFTPLPWLETYFATQSSSNENSARRKVDDDVILALGDFGFGAKARFGESYFWAGPEATLKFLNSVGGTTPDLSATNLYLGGVATVDPARFGFPIRFHVNMGYQWDQSRELCPTDGACNEAEFEDIERVIEEYGQGLNRSRLEIALGADWPLALSHGVWLRPLMEYHITIATGEEDAGYLSTCQSDRPEDAGFKQICGLGRDSQSILFGTRLGLSGGLFADAGLEFGVASPGVEFGPAPAVPPWNFLLGVGYTHDPSPPVRVVEKPRGAAAEKRVVGRVRGTVLDEATQEPVSGAVITFTGKHVTGLATDPDGGFLSYEFPPGPLAVVVRHPAYEPVKAEVDVEVGKDVSLEVRLNPSPRAAVPAGTGLSGQVSDGEGAPLRAVIRIDGPASREVTSGEDGSFEADVPAGEYTVRFEAADYLATERRVVVADGVLATVDVQLGRRPVSANVRVSGSRIVFRRKIRFGTRDARLRDRSEDLLDELADLMLGRPEIRKVRIEGHTDSSGSQSANQRLSEQRAEVVRDYLVKRGVSEERLEAVGYGSAKPIVPNLGARNRAKNRRVELRILD